VPKLISDIEGKFSERNYAKKYIEGDTTVSYDDEKKCQRDIAEYLEKGGEGYFEFLRHQLCDNCRN